MHAARTVTYGEIVLCEVQSPPSQLRAGALARVQVLQSCVVRDHRELTTSEVVVELLDSEQQRQALSLTAAETSLASSAAAAGVGDHMQLGVALQLLQDGRQSFRREVRGQGERTVRDREAKNRRRHEFGT